MTTLAKIKLLFLSLLVLLLLITVFQNLSQIEVSILFWTVQLPQAALLAITLIIGFALGVSANTLRKMRGWRARKKAAQKSPHNNHQ
jgi:uncharacterized integral membrane protein